MRIEFHKEKDLSTKMVSLKRNWISKVRSCARGAETPCVIIHSFAATVTSTHSRDRSTYFLILLHSKSFPYLHPKHTTRGKMFFKPDALVVVPKALFLKWNFMSVIVAFHSITGWRRTKRCGLGEREEKVRLKLWLRNYEAFSCFFSKKFYFERVAILLHFSRFSIARDKNPSWP